ncbi:MAG: hypothetical protein M3Y76_10795, partial [Chloroflexota bacterium]|nr:hypothetical protein [Chloroflexota bacterium]
MKFSPISTMSPEPAEVSGDPLERITSSYPIVSIPQPQLFETPPPPTSFSPGALANGNVVELAVQRLNEAARCIAEVEQDSNRHAPHASHLAPIRDISADIQRHSTPLQPISKKTHHEQEEDLGKRIPDLWPWLYQDSDADESKSVNWANQTDPLLARHFPNSAEVARIEEEDLRRAMAEGLITLPLLPRTHLTPHRRVHMTFVVLVILAIIASVLDGILISVAFLHPRHASNALNGPPSLTLSSNAVRIGQMVTVRIRHFSSSTNVYLTHDIQEAVQLITGSSLVKVGPNGSADVAMLIDANWTSGYHTIEAEDVATRYTASATLQITGAGPTRPSRLRIDTTMLDFGADYQGANTIQSLTLHNSGGGSISWSANSDQPWLLLSPPQGMFSASQTIAVAVERANLKVGDYQGTITFSSNIGAVERISVHMTVRALPANPGAVLEVTPPVLSFTALDGGSDPAAQALTISNPGSQSLSWAINGNNQIPMG